jgi:hypothetical protein
MRGVVLPAVILTAVYSLVIGVLVLFFRVLRVPRRWAILLGFLVYGVISGLLAAWAWPYDSSTLPNLYAVLLGDAIYHFSAQRLGNPWLWSVPQVYVVASTVVCGLVGLLAQWVDAQIRAGRRIPAGRGTDSSLR